MLVCIQCQTPQGLVRLVLAQLRQPVRPFGPSTSLSHLIDLFTLEVLKGYLSLSFVVFKVRICIHCDCPYSMDSPAERETKKNVLDKIFATELYTSKN